MLFSLCRLTRKTYSSTVAYDRLGQSKIAAVDPLGLTRTVAKSVKDTRSEEHETGRVCVWKDRDSLVMEDCGTTVSSEYDRTSRTHRGCGCLYKTRRRTQWPKFLAQELVSVQSLSGRV